MIALIRRWGELVTFSHTIFMMPFAAAAVVLALAVPHESLTPLRVLAIIGCMVTARSSAMAFNRWADRDVDAKNPRTKARPVAAGRISAGEALALTLVAGAAFCGDRGDARALAAAARAAGARRAPRLLVCEALHVGGARVARPRAGARAGRRVARDGRVAGPRHRALDGRGADVALRLRRALRAAGRALRSRRGAALGAGALRREARDDDGGARACGDGGVARGHGRSCSIAARCSSAASRSSPWSS